MTLTITVSLPIVLGALYALIALMTLSAGIITESSFANPNYAEVTVVAAVWPWVVFQITYAKITGRYVVSDVKRIWRWLQ